LALISSTCGVLACGASDAGSEPEAEPSTPVENDVEPATGDDTEDPAVSPNAVSPNCVSPNGVSPNGVSPNAVSPNGVSPNGSAGATEPCESAERIGSFRFYLGDERTIFSGAISD